MDISAISSHTRLAGARAVDDPAATNVARIVISGTRRAKGRNSMPPFGLAYSDTEIAAVVNMSPHGLAGRHPGSPTRTSPNCAARLRADHTHAAPNRRHLRRRPWLYGRRVREIDGR
jgi:hypothetical protein